MSIVIGTLLYGVFAFLDNAIAPEAKFYLWFIRFVIVIPVFIFVFFSTFSERLKKYLQLLISTSGVLAGSGISAMLVSINKLGALLYPTGLLLVIIWVYIFSGLRFINATIASLIVILSYEVVAGFVSAYTLPIFISHNFFIISCFAICMFGGYTIEYYLRKDFVNARIYERQLAIEDMFDAIHNGPLQTLAKLLRERQDRDLLPQDIHSQLQSLDRELRNIYESMKVETITQMRQLLIKSEIIIDLHIPLYELLYEVYRNTLERDLPGFKKLKLKIVNFNPNLDDRSLNFEQKRNLCRFLEEALCNVGKHGIEVTRLTVICQQEEEYNVIRIIDNGTGITLNSQQGTEKSGRGTQQGENLARQLCGHFRRVPHTPQGIVCELTWPIRQKWFRKFWEMINFYRLVR